VTNAEIHKILDKCLEEGKEKNLYGQIGFLLHFQNGVVKQVTDEKIKRTWKGINGKD